MQRVEINTPDVATIAIKGPVQCGKSKVMFRLKQVLENEFGATVVLNKELKMAQNGGEDSDPEPWERRMVGETIWLLVE